MKRLKKISAMLTAFAIIFSMMTFSASAVFSDGSSIKMKEAVDLLTSLSIIKGCPDGNFYPEKTITRGEFVKMLYVLKHGGNDDGATYYKNALNPFTDTKGHWAEGYINYASAFDIVHGTGNGKFQPNSTITGVEAAKILLTVMGYDAEKAGFTGSQWAIHAAATASEKGLFEDYALELQVGCERQYAAQMMYNMLYSKAVTWNGDMHEDSAETIGEKYMDFVLYQGVLVATGDYSLGNVSKASEGKIVIKDKDSNYLEFDYDKDLSDLIGQTVSVSQNSRREKVYGVHTSTDNKVIEAELSDVERKSSNTLNISDKDYKYSDNALAFTGEQSKSFADEFPTTAPNNGTKVRFISNDGDNVLDYAIVYKAKYGKITGIYKDRLATNIQGSSFISLNDEDKKVNVFDGASKDDYIVLTENYFDGSINISEMDRISGKVTVTRHNEVFVSDKWYSLSDIREDGTVLPELSSDVKLYLIGDFIYKTEDSEPSYKNLAYVTGASDKEDLDGNYDVRLLFADGTEKIVKSEDSIETEALVSFDIKKGVYKLTKASDTNLVGTDGFESGNTGFVNSSDKLGTSYIDDNAVIFVQYKNSENKDKYRILKGSELNSVTRDFGLSFSALYINKNGFPFVVGASIKSDSPIPGFQGEYSYGYLTENPAVTKKDDVDYAEYTIWDGSKEVTLLEEGKTAVGNKGDIIRFDMLSNGEIESAEVLSMNTKAVKAYNKYNGDFMVYGDSSLYRITENTVIFYADTEAYKGYETGSVMLADKTSDGQPIGNIRFNAKTEKTDNAYFEVNFIIVDLNNEME